MKYISRSWACEDLLTRKAGDYSIFALLAIIIFLHQSCATYDPLSPQSQEWTAAEEGVRVYLIGDAGILPDNRPPEGLQALQERMSTAQEKDVLLFLGDNIYPRGMSKHPTEQEKKILQAQLDVAQAFKGEVVFIPGNHDWYSGMNGLREQEKMVDDALGKNSFLPEDGFPIAQKDIADDILLLVLDSEWYITNWDRHPNINDNCEIKTRDAFFTEVSSIINKNQQKTIVLAVHHPLASWGNHNGQLTGSPLLFPVDILRRASGVSPADVNFPLYREFTNRLSTILEEYNDQVIVVSGHEHNLQYLEHRSIPQIISGSGSKVTRVRHFAQDSSTYAYAGLGFAVLSLLPHAHDVHFFNEKNELVHTQHIRELSTPKTIVEHFPAEDTVYASIYGGTNTDYPRPSNAMLGEHYRDLYYRQYPFPVVDLDTLHGGLTPIKKGGGFQTVSLRMETKEGKEYVMRRMRKSTKQFIQKSLYAEKYLKDQLGNTLAEKFLLDFYTTAYPFASLLIGDLSDIVGVYHANPKIYYVPQQKSLGRYNEELGDDLYLIEERLDESFPDLESFGRPENIMSTEKVLRELKSDEEFTIELAQYIKTRLFDIWLGDWDRHHDQYRWRETEHDDGTITFAPIPRDRDQAFARFDGFFISLATRLVPQLRKMQSFSDNVRSLKDFSPEMYKVDKIVMRKSTKEQWLAQARFLQDKLTDEAIEQAARNFPDKLKDDNFTSIIQTLKTRRKHFSSWAEQYYDLLHENIIIHGTQKDDLFEVHHLPNGHVKVIVTRIKSSISAQDTILNKTFHPDQTKEIWLYGLGDQDEFHVTGTTSSPIKMKIVGGQKKDTYRIEHSKKLTVYDFKNEKSVFSGRSVSRHLTDDYDLNNYDYHKYKRMIPEYYPALGYNPDDGVIVGGQVQLTQYDMELNPFTSQHALGLRYYSATSGFSVDYTGELAHIIGKNNARFQARYKSPVFAQNFFGLGNETENLEEEKGISFYRTRLEQIDLSAALVRYGRTNSNVTLKIPFAYINPDNNRTRFVDEFLPAEETQVKRFAGVEGSYTYRNKNNQPLSTLGFGFTLTGGWKTDLMDTDANFAYLNSSLKLEYPLTRDHRLSIATAFAIQLLSNDKFAFYQAATLGGRNGLRGFRNDRFAGQKAYVQSSDIRWNLLDFNTGILPAQLGLYGGFDYGRVWLNNDDSNVWHTSYGGGLYIHTINVLTLHTSYFTSSDGGRFTVGVGLGFCPH